MSNEGTMNVSGDAGRGVHWGGGDGKGNGGGNGRDKGQSGSTGKQNVVSSELKKAGDSLARASGLKPEEFSFYFIEEGRVMGVSSIATVGVGEDISAAVVDLGPVPQSLLNSKGNSGKNDINDKYSLSSVYTGNITDARIAELKKIIADNALWANSKQAGRRITKARQATRMAKAELAIANLARQKQAEEKAKNEKDALNKTSELISDLGEKISTHLGRTYQSLANEIAQDIKNFQGKKIRGFNDAMKSLNKITANPAMKINKADKDAIVNAWRHVNANDMANKLGNLSKAFKTADVVMKVEKVRQKSILGYETGDWGPLMLEVESWVISGLAASLALGIFSATLGNVLLAAGVPAVAIGIMGIMLAGYIGSLIDDNFVNRLNNEVIRIAH